MSKYYIDGMTLSDDYQDVDYIGFGRYKNPDLIFRFYKPKDLEDIVLVTLHEELQDCCKDSLLVHSYIVTQDEYEEKLSGIFLTERGVEFFEEIARQEKAFWDERKENTNTLIHS